MAERITPVAIKLAVRALLARENLRRAEAGEPALTQVQLAKGCGVSQSVISTIVSGKIKRIDLKTINGLCEFFNVGPATIFEYTPDRKKDESADA